ncbi:HAMP domain-containing sensor histidine kinase [Bacillus sp. TL12]|uniref:sensor histidine kinase n=1 Tax=Bacillus sp. TL12 TaxID=2894756 RepID=UPI001F525600|nr:HAMP domain-containing sensor histidine kinase [Bacillus sp. TL12]MCI0768212.1 HAMP domain-containing histidine kinase [Bacillus sp. TL12]
MGSKLSIRQWVVITLLLLTLIPFLGTKFASNMYDRYFPVPHEDNQTSKNNIQEWLEQTILMKPELWSTSEWQNKIKKDLANKDLELILFDSVDKKVFTNVNASLEEDVHRKENYSISLSKSTFEKQTVYKEGKAAGTIFVRHTPPVAAEGIDEPKNAFLQEWGGFIIWISLFFLVLFFCSIVTNNMILRPLRLLERAALSLSRNEFSSVLPSSPIKEINAVTDGFKFMQQELQQLLASKAQMEEDRKMFIASIVHDLRTPLFSIRGYLEGLEKGIADTPEKQKKYIKVCKNKADLLEELVSNLFQYVKLDYLGTQPEFQMIDFKKLIKNIAEGYDLELHERNINLTLEVPEDLLMLQGNPSLLTRSIDNIVSNAIRHTPENGSVDIALETSATEMTIIIKDSGEGIPKDILPHIFKPLYRGEYSRNRKTGGTGLGLTIAKHGFKVHGGDLIAKNDYIKGAIFIGHIPINQNNNSKT